MSAAGGLAGHVGVRAACKALGVARATFYRRRRPKTGQRQPRPAPARALDAAERAEVFGVLCSPRFADRAPNEAWSWDITRLLGPEKWRYFYLYVILDIYSRYVTGWMVAERETAGLAGHLVGETCLRQGVQPRVLTLHSDRGPP